MMKKQKTLEISIGALLLMTLSAPVLGVTEAGSGIDDSNSVITAAQAVDLSSGSVTIEGALYFNKNFIPNPPPGMNIYHRDVDFYSFTAFKNDELVLDIDGGIGGALPVDTKLGVFGPGPVFKLLGQNEFAYAVDSGSEGVQDPYIKNFVVPADGTYTVIVAGRNTILLPGGIVLGGVNDHLGNGSYRLNISGTSSQAAAHVNIAISPKKNLKKSNKSKKQKVAKIDMKKKKVKVAILGSKHFPVSAVDTSTLTFGAVGNEKTLRKCKSRTKDLNRDGEPDLECEFSLRDSGFGKHTYKGVLSGKTSDGRSFSGVDGVKVKGKSKKAEG